MANKAKKLPANVPGPFYVDDQCLLCRTCIDAAPAHFAEVDGYAVVQKQPETEEEKALCRKLIEDCPAEAIGEDGA